MSWVGILFALAGMLVFTGQIAVAEVVRILRGWYAAISSLFNHDTDVYPDYIPENTPR